MTGTLTRHGPLVEAAAHGFTRRRLLGALSLACSGAFATPGYGAPRPVRIADTAPGSAGAIDHRVIDKLALEKKRGVALQWVPGQPADSETELVAGSLDLGTFGAIGSTQLNLRGVPIRLIAPALRNHVHWLVRGNSPYKTIADLRGKAIATQPEATETYRTTWMTAALAGIDFKQDYRVHTGSPPAVLALFERGDVEAISITEPTATRLIARGYRELASIADLWSRYTGAKTKMLLVGVAAKQNWIDQNPDEYRRFTALHIDCLSYIEQHPEVFREFAAEIGIPAAETRAVDLLPGRLASIFSPRWDAVEFQGVNQQVDEAVRLGILPGKAPDPFLVPLPA